MSLEGGYRAAREAHHERTIESMRFTLNAEDDTIRLLQDFRKKRNLAEYDKSGMISELEYKEMISTSDALYMQILDWLKEKYSDLIE